MIAVTRAKTRRRAMRNFLFVVSLGIACGFAPLSLDFKGPAVRRACSNKLVAPCTRMTTDCRESDHKSADPSQSKQEAKGGKRVKAKRFLLTLATLISTMHIAPRMSTAANTAPPTQQQASKSTESDITVWRAQSYSLLHPFIPCMRVLQLTLREKCIAGGFLGVAVGLPCVLCAVRALHHVKLLCRDLLLFRLQIFSDFSKLAIRVDSSRAHLTAT